VGALTASSYRFRARPWDLQTAETSCTTCAVGCRGALQSTSNRIVRLLGVDSEPVNQGWLCDKGRYGYEWVHSEARVRAPMVRKNGELVEVSWPEALDVAAAGLQGALDASGPGSIAVLGGARGTNEDAYAWVRLAKGVLGTDNVDAQLGDGLPADVVLGLPGATIADIDRARGVVLVAPDLREELPVLHLRLRRAAVELGVPVIELAPRATGLTRDVTAVLRHAPGEVGAMAEQLAKALATAATASGSGSIEKAVSALDGREGDLVVVIGRQSLAESPASVVQAAAALAALPDVKFLSAERRGNVRGALELGLTPGFLPGRVTLDAARDHFTSEWGSVPAEAGLDAAGIFEAAAAGSIGALVLLGAEPEQDFPDRIRMRAGLDAIPFVVAVGAFTTDAAARADVFLPTSVWGEKSGSSTNVEGRVQRLARLITPEGLTMDDWRIAQELAGRFDADFGFETVEDVQNEIARVAPAFAGVDADLLRRARDGAVLPIADFPDEIVFPRGMGRGPGRSWEPIKPGVADEDTHVSALGSGIVAATGTGATDPIPSGLAPGDVLPGEAESTEETIEAATEELATRPALHTWDRSFTPPVASPRDAYSLRLVAARTLYDAGRMVSETPWLAELATRGALVVHPSDLSRLGVSAEGDDVRVTTPRGTITMPVLADAATAPGTAFMPFAQGGDVGPNDIVDIATTVTELRVETTR
jgi:NADH-quinone oxidoreductase subunit G